MIPHHYLPMLRLIALAAATAFLLGAWLGFREKSPPWLSQFAMCCLFLPGGMALSIVFVCGWFTEGAQP